MLRCQNLQPCFPHRVEQENNAAVPCWERGARMGALLHLEQSHDHFPHDMATLNE